MFSSEAVPRDMSRNSSFFLPNQDNFKHEGELLKSRDFMGSDLFSNQTQQQQQQQASGLARYRSAPSSFLAALLDSNADNSGSGDDSEALFSALMDGPRDLGHKNSNDGNQIQYQLKQEESEPRPGENGYEVGSYSMGMETQVNPRNRNSTSNLVRQTSSPAGFFNGFGVMGEVGNYRVHKANSSSAVPLTFSSGPCSSSRFMPSIPENVNEARNPENGQLGDANNANLRDFDAVFPQDSWNDPPFNTLKRNRDGDAKMFPNFSGLDNQSGEARKNPSGLVHHMSLPKTSSEMAEIEKFLQFQPDTVPCQIRAKRGCATHPRSIAERVRRTKISEKMKKLQDLFPDMDKQTSTADMLDMAVEYIKDLQTQVQTLTVTKANCVCSSNPRQASPAT